MDSSATKDNTATAQADSAVRPVRRRWLWPLLAALLVLTSLAVRSTMEQQAAWSRAVEYEKSGDLWRAVDEYRWVLRWYTPWGPSHDDAVAALQDLAKRAEPDDPELAMQAWDNLRSGLIAGRSLWQPRADVVAQCNQVLPPLLVRVADRRGDGRDKAKLLAQFQRDYDRPVGVAPWTSLAVGLGFALWLLGLVQVVRRGLDEDARWRPAGWPWAGAAVAGFALWSLGMAFG
jgi:hypothetical protein